MLVIYFIIKDLRSLLEIAEFIREIYMKNARTINTTNFFNYGLCRKYGSITERIVKIMISLYGLTTFTIILFPGILFFLDERRLPLCIYVPGLDDQSDLDFSILFVYNSIALIIGMFIACAVNTLILIIFANIPMIATIIIHQLEELKMALMDPECPSSEIKYRILNIVLMIEKYKK